MKFTKIITYHSCSRKHRLVIITRVPLLPPLSILIRRVTVYCIPKLEYVRIEFSPLAPGGIKNSITGANKRQYSVGKHKSFVRLHAYPLGGLPCPIYMQMKVFIQYFPYLLDPNIGKAVCFDPVVCCPQVSRITGVSLAIIDIDKVEPVFVPFSRDLVQ
ncbi:MAG: hypothetical protein PHT97_11960, partial [Methanoculleus sp.]|uniref:hypothetical protein n=1 Tax=Methanoculleus sp. TaxID=90427 RepID=UPI00261DFADC